MRNQVLVILFWKIPTEKEPNTSPEIIFKLDQLLLKQKIIWKNKVRIVAILSHEDEYEKGMEYIKEQKYSDIEFY